MQKLVIHKTKEGDVNVIEHISKNQKIILLCIHGMCSDARIFNYLGSHLSENGITVISVDILGHGKSQGEKGDTNFDKCLVSIDEIIKKYKSTSKIFLLAHSMGCTYALWYCHKFGNSVDGLILMAPYLRIKGIKKRSNVEPNLSSFVKILLRRIFTPSSKAEVKDVMPGFIKYGGNEVSQMANDKDLNFKYSYRYIIDVLALRNDNVPVLSSISKPLLIMHGKNDNLIFSTVSEEFIKLVKTEDKTLSIINSDHWFFDTIFYNQTSTQFIDSDRQKILEIIKSWLLKHC